MKKEFIQVGELRIKKGSIKKYRAIGHCEISINFTSSVSVYETETIKFDTIEIRDCEIKKLDLMFEHDFIVVEDLRIRLNTIKKYKPLNGVKAVLYYSTSRSKVVSDVFDFSSTMKREEFLLDLDVKFGIA